MICQKPGGNRGGTGGERGNLRYQVDLEFTYSMSSPAAFWDFLDSCVIIIESEFHINKLNLKSN